MAAVAAVDARRAIVDPRLVLAAGGVRPAVAPVRTSRDGAAVECGARCSTRCGGRRRADRGGAVVPPALAALSRRCDDAGRPRLRARPPRAGVVAPGRRNPGLLVPRLAAGPPGPLLPPGLLPARARHGCRRHGGVRVRQRQRGARGGHAGDTAAAGSSGHAGRSGVPDPHACAPAVPSGLDVSVGPVRHARGIGARAREHAFALFARRQGGRDRRDRAASLRRGDGAHRHAGGHPGGGRGAPRARRGRRRAAVRSPACASRVRGGAAGSAESRGGAHRLRLGVSRCSPGPGRSPGSA